MPKSLQNTKSFLYIAAAVLIFIFSEQILPYVAFVVGGVVLAYALEEFIYLCLQKKYSELAESMIQTVLAILLFLVHADIVKICIIWGVWSIIREGREMTRAIVNVKKHRLALVDMLESIVVTILSTTMILEPGMHHAYIHMILLGIELLLEIGFPLLENVLELIAKRFQKSSQNPENNEN